MSGLSREIQERASRVRLMLFDVDGVMTDGRVQMNADGSEGRTFHIQDGHGARMAVSAGLVLGVISGRESPVVTQRMKGLGFEELHQGIHEKLERFEEILERRGIGPEAVCFVGDDLIDVPVMRRSGFAAAPADAVPEVRSVAHHVTERGGGRGAVREVIDLVLRATGKWDEVAARYFK